MLLVPHRAHNLGGHVLSLCPNCRCWYGVEMATGESYLDLVGKLVDKEFQAICTLAWHLTSTSRRELGLSFEFTPEERQQAWLVPGSFLDILPLPASPEWFEFERVLWEVLQEARVITIKAPEAPGPP